MKIALLPFGSKSFGFVASIKHMMFIEAECRVVLYRIQLTKDWTDIGLVALAGGAESLIAMLRGSTVNILELVALVYLWDDEGSYTFKVLLDTRAMYAIAGGMHAWLESSGSLQSFSCYNHEIEFLDRVVEEPYRFPALAVSHFFCEPEDNPWGEKAVLTTYLETMETETMMMRQILQK